MTMAFFSIPEKRRQTFHKIAALDKASVNDIFAAIAKGGTGAFSFGFADILAASVKRVDQGDAVDIITALYALFPPFGSSSKSINEFIDDVVASFRRVGPGATRPTDDESERLRDNLKKLLSAPSFGVRAKASGVLLENERNFLLSRVITEVRPVFGMQDDSIAGAVILHSLRISYVNDGSKEEFFVAMDSDDLATLIKDLERAKRKEKKVKDMLSAASVTHMESSKP